MSPFLLVVCGLLLLIAGGEFLVRSSVGLSVKLNLSKMVIGLTVVSCATSAPELIVSVQSAINGFPALALGNIIGSNIANIALVLGITAMISNLTMSKLFIRFNWTWMMGMSAMLYIFLHTGNNLLRWEGSILLLAMMVFLVVLIKNARNNPEIIIDDSVPIITKWRSIVVFLIIGGLSLWLGSELLVQGAVTIANNMGIPESIIAVSMVAVGTSIPELAASIIAAIKKENAISLGNLIGSNIFNIGFVLGMTSIIKPITIDQKSIMLIHSDIYWMLGIAMILLPLALLPKRYFITRWNGLVLILTYISFIYLAFSTL